MSDRLQFLAPSNPLRRAGYRYLIYFSLIVAMGGGFHFIGSYWILYRKTSSPASVAWLIMAYWVPSLFVMPFAGVLTALQREASPEVIGRITSTIQVCQYLMFPPIIWLLGTYASLETGRLIHAAILRDSFVAASVLLLIFAVVSSFTAYPFLRRSINRESFP